MSWCRHTEEHYLKLKKEREAYFKPYEAKLVKLISQHFSESAYSVYNTLLRHAKEFREVLAPFDLT